MVPIPAAVNTYLEQLSQRVPDPAIGASHETSIRTDDSFYLVVFAFGCGGQNVAVNVPIRSGATTTYMSMAASMAIIYQ